MREKTLVLRNSPLPMAISPASSSALCRKSLFVLSARGDQFLRPALEQHAGLRQDDVVVAPDKELDPELLLQLHDLAGQGGLCHMKHLRGPGDVFLPGDGQEVVQNAKFHRSHLLPP